MFPRGCTCRAHKFFQNMSVTITLSGFPDRFEMPRAAAEMSTLIKTMLEDSQEENPEVPLMEISPEIFTRVKAFCEYHQENPMKEIPRPIPTNKLEDIVGEWDANLVDLAHDQETLVLVILAANYLDIKSLLELAVCRYACMLKGKDAKEVCEILKIDKEMTPEEERAIRMANPWIFETAPKPEVNPV